MLLCKIYRQMIKEDANSNDKYIKEEQKINKYLLEVKVEEEVEPHIFVQDLGTNYYTEEANPDSLIHQIKEDKVLNTLTGSRGA